MCGYVYVCVCGRQLKCEVARVSEERDDALLRMSNANQQAEQNAESLRNLQTALDQLQRGHLL